MIKSEDVKILKCKNLIIEIQHMWNVKTKVVPVILGAPGIISVPEQHTGKDKIKYLQKTAIMSNVQLLQKVLM